MPKPDHRDLALEDMASQLCETEHAYVSTRFLLSAALTEIRRLQRCVRIAERYHKHDRQQIQQLMGIPALGVPDAHHESVGEPVQ